MMAAPAPRDQRAAAIEKIGALCSEVMPVLDDVRTKIENLANELERIPTVEEWRKRRVRHAAHTSARAAVTLYSSR